MASEKLTLHLRGILEPSNHTTDIVVKRMIVRARYTKKYQAWVLTGNKPLFMNYKAKKDIRLTRITSNPPSIMKSLGLTKRVDLNDSHAIFPIQLDAGQTKALELPRHIIRIV